MSDTWRLVVLLLAAGFLIEAVFLVAVMRQMGELLLRGVGPTAMPVAGGPELGTSVEIPGVDDRVRPALVVFTSSLCEQCRILEPGLQQIHSLYGPDAHDGHQLDLVAVLTDANPTGRAEHARELGGFARTDLIALMQDWSVPGTPFAVALDSDHRVRGAEVVNSQLQLEMLAVEKLGVLFVPPEERADEARVPDVHQVGANGARTVGGAM